MDSFDPTEALSVIEQTSPTGYEAAAWDVDTTGQFPVTVTGEAPALTATQPFRITPLVAVSAAAAVLAVATAFVDVATWEVDGGGAITSTTLKLNDFATNYTVGAFIAALLLVGGAILGATGRRTGAGLAGGAGLALAGMMGMVLGQVTQVFDTVEVGLVETGGSFTITTTQEIGFWLAVAAAAFGAIAFFCSLTSARRDGHSPLNPAIGMIGVLGTLAVMAGPLIPINDGGWGDNFTNEFVPPATIYLRLLVLALIGVGGLVGFLARRRWGIGLAIGAISVGIWQWASSISASGDIPSGIALANPGANAISDLKPHIVTTIGVVVMVLAAIAGVLAAAQQRDAR